MAKPVYNALIIGVNCFCGAIESKYIHIIHTTICLTPSFR